MRRVLLIQPSLQPPGGGNGVAAWMLQALARAHRVTVLSAHPVEVEPINRFFGTTLRSGEFDTIVVPRSWTFVPEHLPVPAALLQTGLLMRYTRRVSDAFDVILGAHNEADFGRRGIQYVHYPTYFRPRPEADFRWYHRSKIVLNGYYAFADWLADVSFDRMKTNTTLANSDWTASRVQHFLGITARTIYPPVISSGPGIAWNHRHSGFLAIGRLSPEKEFERLIRIIARVRAIVPDVTLTIIGTWDRYAGRYYRSLRALASSFGSWVDFRRDLTRDEVRELMGRYRYGIHGMREEHFGMAPAEMVRAGMIVWVPNGGGQVEIVGDEAILRYEREEEAAERIMQVLSSASEQSRLRELLAQRAERFGTDRFIAEVREVVRDFRE